MTTKDEKATLAKEDVEKPVPTLVPPDGGWGWFIVLSYILIGVFNLTIVQLFGLLYKGYFKTIGLSATDVSLILNINSSVTMCTGLLNGPLLKRYGIRKVSLTSSLILFIGLVLTSQADSFGLFIFSYSIVAGLGVGPLMASSSFALNLYFKKRRSKATGYAMTGMGMGPILMPFLMTYLLKYQGVKGAGIIQASLSLHSFVGGLLLQPVKWHMKKEYPEDVSPFIDGNKDEEPEEIPKWEEELNQHDMEVQSIYGVDTPLPERRRISLVVLNRANSQIDEQKYWHSSFSVNTINLGSSWKIFEDEGYKPLSQGPSSNENNLTIQETIEEPTKRDNCCLKVTKQIFHFFDFDLLRDPYYLNLLAGMSLAMTGEINFSLLTPFILADFGLIESEIATVMSVIGILDIIFRFIAPYIGDGFKLTPRIMYMIAMCLLISSRMSLLFTSSYISILCVAAFLGIAKGIRTVYMVLVIPAYVPIERLASASGIQMLTHGLVLLISGPVLGYIRDISGSYRICILIINLLTLSAIVIWSIELLWTRYRASKQKT